MSPTPQKPARSQPAPTILVPPVASLANDPLIGQTVARCRIDMRIGEGRTSVVYRATHGSLGIPVAVKILKPAVLAFPEIVSKFEIEARAIARLDHPNVLKIYDVAAEGDRHSIVMELLEGESVLDLLSREERVDPVDALRIVRQAASGLAAAHAKGIIHRDVKPQNLVVLPDGTVKLVDFGLATEAESEMAASRIGTPHYMAPEVCEARPAEPKSDVYSLGITLYHLLVGSPPYAGMSVREILAAHVEGRPLHPERRLPGLPKPICDLVRDMTKRDPLLRPTAQEVVAAVDAAGGNALASSPRLRVGRRRASRKSSPAAAIAVVGGIVGVILLVILTKNAGSGSPNPPVTRTPTPSVGTTEPTTPAVSDTPPPAPPPETVKPKPKPEPQPIPPKETDDQRRVREAAEAKARRSQAEYAFTDAENFARSNWQDKTAVVREYRQVSSLFKDVEDVAKKAKERADGIEKGTIHPHPDRTFAPPSAIETARSAWAAARPEYEKALAELRFLDAEKLVPPPVDDRDLAFSEDIEFWRRLARDAGAFLDALGKDVEQVPSAQRKVKTAKGEARVVGAAVGGLKVESGDDRLDVRWAEMTPDSLLTLASKAFAKQAADRAILTASFAFALRLQTPFYQAALTVPEASKDSEQAHRAMERAKERFKR